MTQLQDTAAMHAALNYALTKAERQIEAGEEIPWQDLEDAIELVVKHGVATQEDLDRVRRKELSVPRLKELLAKVKEGYGNLPQPPKM
jgi:hypothetical protein